MFEQDFNEVPSQQDAMSVDDRKFIAKVSEGIRRRDDGHFEIPLPFKEDVLKLPNNRDMAMSRLRQLKARMTRNDEFRTDYSRFLQKIIDAGQAEQVPEDEVELNDGMVWYVGPDTFQFRVQIKEKPVTRRGTLSVISSVFDPLGLISPFILKGKWILKYLCKSGKGWDDAVPEEICGKWEEWKADLQNLSLLSIPRCYKTPGFGTATSVELHRFSDASFDGYGQCSYVRLTDDCGKVDTALVMAKSRVTPSKAVTIPRLELTAALTSARVGKFLSKELNYGEVQHFYYTDSQVVLG
jgi:hypothetical protein